jgi:tRNA (guanine37-N1)-methyltransferase
VVIPAEGVVFQHAIMNLPASGVEFLDAFRGSFHPETWKGKKLPLVHVYTFARTSESDKGEASSIMARLHFNRQSN